MWCRVQVCFGPNGERLKRGQWGAPVYGDLTIRNAKHSLAAWLERLDLDRRYQVLFPLADARVQTFDAGFIVAGYQCTLQDGAVREVRQAWYCIPAPEVAPRRPEARTTANG